MKQNCSLYGAHYWKLDNKSYGRCQCGAERDFQEQEKRERYPKSRDNRKTEFYNQGSLDQSIRIG